MTDQELFEKLKREGEEWMDFYWLVTVPEDEWKRFGWLWERAQEKEWWEGFLLFEWNKEFEVTQRQTIVNLIHPTHFTEALKEYLEEG